MRALPSLLFSSAYEATVPAGRQALIKTDLSIAIPPNTYARIAPRSGLAVKKMIDCGAGVVDYDYRGPIGVVLFNHGSEDFQVKKGDRVAQLILERICMADVEEVFSELALSLLLQIVENFGGVVRVSSQLMLRAPQKHDAWKEIVSLVSCAHP